MLEAIKNRRSIREFKNEKVEVSKMNEIFEAIQMAPSWKNKQCWEVIHIDDREIISKIGALCRYNPSESAYHDAHDLLVFCADPTRSGNRDDKPYYMSDCAIAMTHATLAASHLGLGTCWVGIFPEDTLKELLHIPNELRIVGLLPVGIPNEVVEARPRRDINDILHHNTFK